MDRFRFAVEDAEGAIERADSEGLLDSVRDRYFREAVRHLVRALRATIEDGDI